MKNLKHVGFWSGLLTAVFSIAYSIFHLLGVFTMVHYPWDLFGMFLPSLFLSVAFVLLMIAVYVYAGDEVKIFGLISIACAVIYAVMVGIVYFVQLTVVIPAILAGKAGPLRLLMFEPGSFLVAVDALGYVFMSLSTLFAGLVFSGVRIEKWIRLSLFANGLLAPIIIMAVMYPVFMYIGALWIITMPLSAILLTRLFHKMM